ncbi:hypothetical protein FQN50_007171 [Emmonsiellopsis sp. PD_5]|nr:hypothetical protein FQN50_007171 [Emmonsiellopsis sp. PD_5]
MKNAEDTPLEHPGVDAPRGFTLRFTIHRALNLPIADLASFSSDPYVVARLSADLPRRSKQDPPDLVLRTPTIHRNVNPVWDCAWIVANIPASGFKLKCRIYDEDPVDHDDRLGNVLITADSISDTWPGIRERPYRVKKRMGSKRAYFVRSIAFACAKDKHLNASFVVSVECLGRTPAAEAARMYTVGPLYWSKHFSPLIGRLTGTKDPALGREGKRPVTRYNFQAVQLQLKGPVPSAFYHRYVEFRPFVAGMFTSHTLLGRFLNHTLHHQHARIYSFDQSTVYGVFPDPSYELTQQFLDFVHYGQGGRIYTYVITLDGQWRFTETGKEFAFLDLLSKHAIHSDLSIHVAYAGEFLVRRLRRDRSHPPPTTDDDIHEDVLLEQGDSATAPDDPAVYELIIDNNSGTYRPDAQCLPALKKYLSMNLPGLEVTALDCQEDAQRLDDLKTEQRERKSMDGRQLTYMQISRSSSISSSDEEALDEYSQAGDTEGGHTFFRQMKRIMTDPKLELVKWAETGGKARPQTVL